MNDDGKLALAPFYDILPTKVILPTDKDDLGLLLNGKKQNIRKGDFDTFAKSVGISEYTKNAIMKEIDYKEEEMCLIIDNSLLSKNAKSVWKKLIHKNIKRSKLV